MRFERQSISKKLRFEVFKRDEFTCQYCGASAPDVRLHCDHMIPVVDGGETDILNLITACEDCNFGKGSDPLSENSFFRKSIDEILVFERRREQALMEWRERVDESMDEAESLLSIVHSSFEKREKENHRSEIKTVISKVVRKWEGDVECVYG